jgi:hypothetical protein
MIRTGQSGRSEKVDVKFVPHISTMNGSKNEGV